MASASQLRQKEQLGRPSYEHRISQSKPDYKLIPKVRDSYSKTERNNLPLQLGNKFVPSFRIDITDSNVGTFGGIVI